MLRGLMYTAALVGVFAFASVADAQAARPRRAQVRDRVEDVLDRREDRRDRREDIRDRREDRRDRQRR
jgi:hypothetical protein